MPDVSPDDLDIMARTMIGEDPTPEGQAAVAHVIMNRAASGDYPASPSAVALQRNQFEPWSTRRRELMGIPTSSPSYQQAYSIAQRVANGAIPDPTGGAVLFYAPRSQLAEGRSPPAWSQGRQPSAQIGGQVYYTAPGSQAKPGRLTDPFSEYQTGAEPSMSSSAAPAQAAPAVPLVDPFQEYPTNAAPPVRAIPKGPIGPNGLIWDQAGGHDPTTGELVIGGKPFTSDSGILSNSPTDTWWSSAAKNVGTGLIKGAADIPGVFGNMDNALNYVIARGVSAATGNPTDQILAEKQARQQAVASDLYASSPGGKLLSSIFGPKAIDILASDLPTGAQIAAPILSRTGEYQPQSALGRAVQGGVETAVGALGVGGAAMAAPKAIAANALMGTAATGATEASGDPLVGMGALLAVPGGIAAGRRGISALAGSMQPETAALAQTAMQRYGIPLGVGQISDSPAVRFASSVTNRLPFSGAGNDIAATQSAFNRAVSNTLGEDVTKITPSIMASAKARIGGEFDRVAQGTTITFDQQLADNLMKPLRDASSVLPQAEIAPLIKQVNNVLDTVQPGNVLSGDSYQALTRKGAPLDRAMNSSDPNVAFYAGQIRDALDDALQRHAPPDLADALTAARSQYKAMKTIEPLVAKSTTGDVSPALLMAQVTKKYGNMAYGGGGDLGDLARIGQRFLKEPPSSGTPERASVMSALSRIGGLTGAGLAGLGAHDVLSRVAPAMTPTEFALSAASLPITLGLGRIVGNTLRSPALASDVINRSLGLPGLGSPLARRFLGASLPYALQAAPSSALLQQAQ